MEQQHPLLTIEQVLAMPDDDFVILPIERLRHLMKEDVLRRLSRRQLKELDRKLDIHPHTISVKEARKRDRKFIKRLEKQNDDDDGCMCTIA